VVEVAVVVAKVVAEQGISSSSSKIMMGSSNTQVEEASLEAGGVKEVVDFKDSKMTGAVTIVVSLGMYRLIVIRGKTT